MAGGRGQQPAGCAERGWRGRALQLPGGSCHACLVRCLAGVPGDARPDALSEGKRLEGWRLACQCRVESDLQVAVFDPVRDGAPARVVALDWLGAQVLRLRLQPDRPLRYQAGQHLVLWSAQGVARPYSLASVPGEDEWLEFHLDCRHAGAFCSAARGLQVGDLVRLGSCAVARCITIRTGRPGRCGCWRRVPGWRHCGDCARGAASGASGGDQGGACGERGGWALPAAGAG
ncbi:2Fe-2S iron-sulfur cluster-binding protein [Pseudomonas qingdaonensis]|nr:2Fe-2S iron-sulfur cluster-binding protein [Pseudomonas qingdaonensis]